MSVGQHTRPRVFISHSSRDRAWANDIHELLQDQGYRPFYSPHADDGIPAGADWERALWRQIRRCRGMVVLCSPTWLSSPWCIAEAMLFHERGKPIIPIVSAGDRRRDEDAGRERRTGTLAAGLRLPPFLDSRQVIDAAQLQPERVEQRLLAGLDTALGKDFPAPDDPYPGLKPFEARHAGVFFGRDDETEDVLRLLRQWRWGTRRGFILVLGASGSGKSSLVRAGVIPRVRRASEHGTDAWIVPRPFHAQEGTVGLARVLADALDGVGIDRRTVDRALQATRRDDAVDVEPLAGLVRSAVGRSQVVDGRVLVVIDQLEEVFRTPEHSDARHMLRLLLESQEASGLAAIATMRSDSLDDFQRSPGAAHRYEKVTLDPMQRTRFPEIIAKPAERCGIELEVGLVERMVEDAGYDDALPLLAYTLEKLHERGADDFVLELSEYEDLFGTTKIVYPDGSSVVASGVTAAVKVSADRILEETGYAGLSDDDPRLRDLKTAFLQLVEIGPEGRFLRRTARRSSLPTSCDDVIRYLVAERLLTAGEAGGERTITVAHEAIFRVWDTLRLWLERSRNTLMLRTQIRRSAADWNRRGRDELLRWPEGRVVDAVMLLERAGIVAADPFDEVEHAFLGPLSDAEVVDALQADSLTLVQRARLGRRLSLFGDRRSGTGVDDDGTPAFDWLTVPSGTVVLRDLSAEERRLLQQELSRLTGGSVPDPASGSTSERHLTARARERHVEQFEVSRYPVTRAQYNAFVTSDDFDDPAWWRDLDRPAQRPAETTVATNHPATHLSWFEAVAFCRWAGSRVGATVRLPTEFEWQQAATGGDDRPYPWGDLTVDPSSRANSFESRIRENADFLPTTTAVGVFPHGASPVGALDMSGNVWEWCDTCFYADQTHQHAPRVVKGGSWVIGLPACTCVYAGQLTPDADQYFVGFRPVRVAA